MSTSDLFPEERLTVGDLIAEISAAASQVGPNRSVWQGLTVYKFTSPMVPQWDEVRSLALCFVAQGRKRVAVEGGIDHFYDPFRYLVFTRGQRFQAEILEASAEKPFLSFVLQIDPGIVRQVSSDMLERSTTTFHRPVSPPVAPAYVSTVDIPLTGAILRFLRSITSGADRRVLAPMYLQEICYRLLQAEQCSRLLAAAATEHELNPVSQVIRYVQEHMNEPVTVADLADHVAMSPSAFAHLFREVTGMSPYQFVKRMRLDRARTLLVEEGLSVSEVAREVGYTSLSHFITEFKRHFGVTPRAYAETQRTAVALQVDRATSRVRTMP
ncbi:AraC-type DNA-binding protein [Amycolatopsis rubida]|uniref:AraC-type DNA-binding protein n=1 Tax=Amycolatopsis rubida TaxID=112413 RepID=A0A1I5NDS4_9PSEU|nr:AraC-type DNA-binding protein [Amycolatopsis rubida]